VEKAFLATDEHRLKADKERAKKKAFFCFYHASIGVHRWLISLLLENNRLANPPTFWKTY
jgi:hypothetical protein